MTNVANTDIQIALLQTNMDENVVAPACLLPTNYWEYISTGDGLPVLAFDKEEHGVIRDIVQPIPYLLEDQREVRMGCSRNADRARFFEVVKSGDSGNPAFLVVNGNALLLGVGHVGYGGINGDNYPEGSVPFLTYYAEEVQRLMDVLAEGYHLRFYDLSSFPKLHTGE